MVRTLGKIHVYFSVVRENVLFFLYLGFPIVLHVELLFSVMICCEPAFAQVKMVLESSAGISSTAISYQSTVPNSYVNAEHGTNTI